MTNIQAFRAELEKRCKIYKWNPSDEELQGIAAEIAHLAVTVANIDRDTLVGVVTRHAKVDSFLLTEGIDNSDLKTLLLLATRAR
ncbi:hypothetical protein [Collimonas pratensis]|uniref:hypothetical protein n=1 Tax=Collimonas pratensis TaxID=279113 RepID=UPI000784E365|nr:hypothetical protein [Collimonas pratensis]